MNKYECKGCGSQHYVRQEQWIRQEICAECAESKGLHIEGFEMDVLILGYEDLVSALEETEQAQKVGSRTWELVRGAREYIEGMKAKVYEPEMARS